MSANPQYIETEEGRRRREFVSKEAPRGDDLPKYAEPVLQQAPSPLMDSEPLPMYQPPKTVARAPVSEAPTYTAPSRVPDTDEPAPLMVVKNNGRPTDRVIGEGSPLDRKAAELEAQIAYKPENHNSRGKSGLIQGGRGFLRHGLIGGIIGLIQGLANPKSDEEEARSRKIGQLQPEVAVLQKQAKAQSDLADDALDREYKRTRILKELRTPTHAPQLKVNESGGLDRISLDNNSVSPVKNVDGSLYKVKPEATYTHSADGSMIWETSPGKIPKLITDQRKEYDIGGTKVKLTDPQYANYVAQRADAESRQQKDQVDRAAQNEASKSNIQSMQDEQQKIWTSIKDMPRSIKTLNSMGDEITIMNPEYKEGIDRYQKLDDDMRKEKEKIKPIPSPVTSPKGAQGPKYKVDSRFLQ